jgi:hypothetical protein
LHGGLTVSDALLRLANSGQTRIYEFPVAALGNPLAGSIHNNVIKESRSEARFVFYMTEERRDAEKHRGTCPFSENLSLRQTITKPE